MKTKLNISLVDDHNLFREGLKLLLSRLSFVDKIFEASNGKEFIDQLPQKKPDIALLDIEMPVMDGIKATKLALQIMPELKIIGLSMYADQSYYTNMIEAGAKGFLMKNSSFDDVQRAISDVAEGRSFFSGEIMHELIQNINRKKIIKQGTNLTDREIEILFQICKGLSNQEIADKLYLSKRTVDKHRENLLLKTGSKNTASLVIFAIKNEIIEI
ncbi:MAG: response regulator transcription factor [Bacteroidales bacterium]|nr:response regulator transcription factor [Bacteroidales bacterium]